VGSNSGGSALQYRNASSTPPSAAVANSSGNITYVTILTMGVAQKLKFNEGIKIRPWVISIGLAVHVIGPHYTRPSTGISACSMAPALSIGSGKQSVIKNSS
jgi:hypothetical protein